MPHSDNRSFDIVIVGGGLIGLTAALACAQNGFTVAVVEQQSEESISAKAPEIRCSAISRKSQRLLDSLGVWSRLPLEAVSPYLKMVVWDEAGFGEIEFEASLVGEPNLGHIVENKALLDALKAHCHEITFFQGAKPIALTRERDSIVLELKEGPKLKARLIIGADGKHSWLRQALQIPITQKDYQQTAWVANVQTAFSHQQTAWQRFLPEGPLAFLPLKDPHLSAVVWTASPSTLEQRLKLGPEALGQVLSDQLEGRLGQVSIVSESYTFPLSTLLAQQFIQERAVLIGDALHVVHPLAGLGVNLGFEDILILVPLLKAACQAGIDIGRFDRLRSFERKRKGSLFGTMSALEGLHYAFGKTPSWVMLLRSLGLNGINNSPFFKKRLIKAAMGL